MEEKIIDLTKSVYELCSDYPELQGILASVGFQDITKPGMLPTVGRFMTIPKGAAAKRIELDRIKEAILERGFMIKP